MRPALSVPVRLSALRPVLPVLVQLFCRLFVFPVLRLVDAAVEQLADRRFVEVTGGNGTAVTEFGSTQCGRHPCNLHGAWDSGLIQHTGMGRDEYVAHLETLISDEHLTASGNPEDWANESHGYAQSAWLADGAQIDENYYRKEIKVVDKRLALAGLCLAAVSNEAFAQAQH